MAHQPSTLRDTPRATSHVPVALVLSDARWAWPNALVLAAMHALRAWAVPPLAHGFKRQVNGSAPSKGREADIPMCEGGIGRILQPIILLAWAPGHSGFVCALIISEIHSVIEQKFATECLNIT